MSMPAFGHPPLARHDREAALQALADEVRSIAGDPIDAWAVAATLESRGMRDSDAVSRYGCADVFELAEEVLARCRDQPQRPAAEPVEDRTGESVRLRGAIARGAFFFVPLALQIASLIAFGYSQWASVHFSLTQASIVALAAGASFVATGGFAQAIGHLGPMFKEPRKDMLTERLTWIALALGALFATLLGVALAGAQALTGSYSADQIGVGSAYFALLSALWLANGTLYMLRRHLAMVVATLAGIGAVVALHGGAGFGIYLSQWISTGVSIAISLLWAGVTLSSRAARTNGDMRLARFPPRRILLSAAAPFFCYGTLYFAFIFCDRLVAWSAGSHPLPVWFNVAYELGLDAALVAAVPGLAYLEHPAEELTRWLVRTERRFEAGERTRCNLAGAAFLRRQALIAVACSVCGIALVLLVLLILSATGALGSLERYVEGGTSPRVFAFAAAGYSLLTLGVLNASVLISLSRVWAVVAAVVAALAVDAGVGLALTSSGEHWHAVVGLAAGCAVLAATTALAALRTLRHADYRLLLGS